MDYQAYGVVISSALALPELTPVAGCTPLLTVTMASESAGRDEWDWVQPRPLAPDDTPDGVWVAVGRRGGRHRLLFDGHGDFVVSAREGRIVADPNSDDPFTIRHLLIDQVIPRVLGHQGRFVLHAGAFVTPAGAVAIVGRAGAGKSTLSASFGLHGMPVISDDALVVQRMGSELFATPAYPSLRVRPAALPALAEDRDVPQGMPPSEKRRFGPADGVRFADGPAPLRRVYLLQEEPAARIEIRDVSPRDAVMAVLSHSFILDVSDRTRLGEHFAAICAAFAGAEVRRLTYPRQFSALPQVRDAILNDLART